MFAVSNMINLFFLSIPLYAAVQGLMGIVAFIKTKGEARSLWGLLFHVVLFISASLFALYYFDRIS